MTKGVVPKEVKRFIAEHINSVFQLEVLLLLFNDKEREWSATGVDRELGIGHGEALEQMADLHSRGLLSYREATEALYHYSPNSDQLDRAVSGLAKAYKERRINVISSIFSKPVDKARLFAEAFRIRKD